MRHFEKKGSLRLYRRIGTKGATLQVAVGRAAEDELRVSLPCASAAAAERSAEAWARWALDAGYAEIALPPGVPGIVRSLKSPAGPGRVRTDSRGDVYFEAQSGAPAPMKIGQRVVAQGIRRDPRLKVDFMFGSPLRASGLLPFPEPVWSHVRVRPDPAAKIRRSLIALAGEAILGHAERKGSLEALRPGDLFFAYEKGVHRLLKRTRGMVYYEAVLTSGFVRQSSPPLLCVPKFCAALPGGLRRAVEAEYGLGLRR